VRAKRLREIPPHTLPQTLKIATTKPKDPFLWIAVLDFDSPHGESTTWLTGSVAGTSVTTALAPLDDPALADLGPVGDIHVLARLCEIAQVVDSGALPPPTTINMSFGRLRRVDPDLNPDPASADCDSPSAACQVAQVAGYLRAKGTWLVAAAGNHGAELFPGSLAEVVAAGMLDSTLFARNGEVRRAWETPSTADALIPGNALCLNSWSAPAGSSYSSALLAGWLVQVLTHPTILDTLPSGMWIPVQHPTKDCPVLGRGDKLTPWCNTGVTALFGGLTGAVPTTCTAASAGITETAPSHSRATPPGSIPSIDAYGDPTHPTPESDPCVPCTGVIATNEGDTLTIDLSKSGPLPEGIVFDAVKLRVEEIYFPIDLDARQLELMNAGELSTLVIPGIGRYIPPGGSVSMWYRMRDRAAPDCGSEAGCFWSSTPLLLGTVD
jgi:hypothetical protein